MTLPTIAGVQSRIYTLADRPPFMIIREMAEALGFQADSLSKAFRRNREKFPAGYFFVLTPEEYMKQSGQNVRTAERSRTDLEQFGFPEKGALFLLRFVTGDQADRASIMLIEAFADQRDTLMAAMRRELAVDRQAYINARNIRGNIEMAAREGWNFIQLQDRFGYSPKLLTMEIEAMRARGYISAMALTPPLYVLKQIEAKRAFTAVHVEDTAQLRLGLEG